MPGEVLACTPLRGVIDQLGSAGSRVRRAGGLQRRAGEAAQGPPGDTALHAGVSLGPGVRSGGKRQESGKVRHGCHSLLRPSSVPNLRVVCWCSVHRLQN